MLVGYLIFSILFMLWMFVRWSTSSHANVAIKMMLFLAVTLGIVLLGDHFHILYLKWAYLP